MDLQLARETILNLLRSKGRAKNSEMLGAIAGDEDVLKLVREDLIFDRLAEDVEGVGLKYTGPAAAPQAAQSAERPRVFISYGRRDAKELADQLAVDLRASGYDVWQDTCEIVPGDSWQHEIADGLRSAQIVLALMTPHSVRTTRDADSPDHVDSVSLAEISFALFHPPPQPVVPVMVKDCEPPLAIFHLDYVDLRAWSESTDQYQAGLKRLLDGLQAALRGEKRYRSWYHQLDPWDFAAFLHSKRRGFCGRQWLFDRIDAWRMTHRSERALLIKGDPGTGKSAIVAELVHRNPGGQVLAYHCCQWDVPDTLEPWRFVRSIAAMIASQLDAYAAMMRDPGVQEALSPAKCQSDPASALERGVLAPLERLHAPEGGPRYLLIDALDESLFLKTGSGTIVDLLASRLDRLPPWLRIVATTRKEKDVLNPLRGRRAEELDTQSPENLEDLRHYIALRLASPNLKQKLTEAEADRDEVARVLCEKGEGNFLYAEQALDGIERDEHQLGRLDALPPGMAGLYVLRFKRQFPDQGSFADAKRLLDVIVAAREPLSEEQIAAATGLDRDEELPIVLRRLSSYVPARLGPDGLERYAAYHKSLVDWLTRRRGELHSASPKRGHARLAESCWQEYERGVDSMSPYAVAHLPAHLLELGWWTKLALLVADPGLGLIEKWVERGDALGLTCLNGLVEKGDLKPVHQAFLSAQAARIYSRHGKHSEAERRLKEAVQQTSWRRGRRTRAIALHEMGSVYLSRGKKKQATRQYRRALRLCVWGVPVFHDEAAANRIALATIAFTQYHWGRVVRLARRAQREAQAAGDSRHAIAANRLIGLALDDLGRYQEAESELQAALESSQHTGAALETARLLNLKGCFYHGQATLRGEHYERATESFRQAMEVAESIYNLYSFVDAKLGLGWSAVADGKAGEAVDWFEQARASLSTEAYPELWIVLRLGNAATLHQSGALEKAAPEYQNVLAEAKRRDFRGTAARALVGLGAIHWHSGRREQANTAWTEARRIAKRNSPRDQQLTEANIRLCRTNPSVAPR